MKGKKITVSILSIVLTVAVLVGLSSGLKVNAETEVKTYDTSTKMVSNSQNESPDNEIDEGVNTEASMNDPVDNPIKIPIKSDSEDDGNEASNDINKESTFETENQTDNQKLNSNDTYVLKNNEALVDSYDEFKNLVQKKGNGVIDTYYMTSDFNASYGFTIPSDYGFTLDGKNPNTGETHTYRQTVLPGASRYESMNNSGTTPKTIEMRNMKIISSSRNGILNSLSSGTTQIYNNVNHEGNLLSSNNAGQTIYRNISAKDTVLEPGVYIHSGYNLDLEGNVTIESVGNYAINVFSMSSGRLVVKEDAVINFIHTSRIASVNIFEMEKNSTIIFNSKKIDIGHFLGTSIEGKEVKINDAKIISTVDSNVPRSMLIQADNLEMTNSSVEVNASNMNELINVKKSANITNSTISLNADVSNGEVILGSVAGSTIKIVDSKIVLKGVDTPTSILSSKGRISLENTNMEVKSEKISNDIIKSDDSIEIMNRSSIKIDTDGLMKSVLLAKNDILVSDSNLDISINKRVGSQYTQSIFAAKIAKINSSKVNIYSNDLDIKNIFNVTSEISIIDTDEKPGEFRVESEFDISLSQSVYPVIKIQTQQINTSQTTGDHEWEFRRKDYAQGEMEFKIDAKGNIKFTKNNFSDPDYPDPVANLKLNNIKRLSIGTVKYELSEPENLYEINFVTNREANTTFTYNESIEIASVADSEGRVNLVLDPVAKAGYHDLVIKSGGLIRREVIDLTKFGTVDLVEYPETLSFKSQTIPRSHQRYNSLENQRVVVEDTRSVRSGWKLEMKLKTPLSAVNNSSNILEDAIIYVDPFTQETKVLSEKSILIYQAEGEYDSKVSIDFGDKEGILMEFYGANGIYQNTSYLAEIEWVLSYVN